MFDRLVGQVLDDMTRAAARELSFLISSRFPKPGNVSEPQVTCLDVHGHLANVMLDVRIVNLILALQILDRIFECGFGSAQEGCRVMVNETGLQSFFDVLPGITNEIIVSNDMAP